MDSCVETPKNVCNARLDAVQSCLDGSSPVPCRRIQTKYGRLADGPTVAPEFGNPELEVVEASDLFVDTVPDTNKGRFDIVEEPLAGIMISEEGECTSDGPMSAVENWAEVVRYPEVDVEGILVRVVVVAPLAALQIGVEILLLWLKPPVDSL